METTEMMQKRGISGTGLKWIALVTMVLDHIHYFFGFTGAVPEWFSMVGRVSAPLFLFCLVEGLPTPMIGVGTFCVSGAFPPEWVCCSS